MREGLEVVQGGDRAGWLAAPPSDYDDEGAPLWHEAEQFFNHCSWAVDVDETINMDTCSECSDGLSGDEDILPVDDALEADTTAEAYHSGKDMQVLVCVQFCHVVYHACVCPVGHPMGGPATATLAARVSRHPHAILPQLSKPWGRLHCPQGRPGARAAPSRNGAVGAFCQTSCNRVAQGCTFFDFFRSYRCVQSSVVHFQLRHLLWATSGVDVYVQNNNTVSHWNLATRTETKVRWSYVLRLTDTVNNHLQVLDAATMHRCNSSLGKVQLSTLCVKHGLVAAGGFNGELLVRRLSEPDFLCGCVQGYPCVNRFTHCLGTACG